jgi:hypothetical protein
MIYFVLVVGSLIVGAGCGYGFRGYIARERAVLAGIASEIIKKL